MTITSADLTFLRSAIGASEGGSASGVTAPSGVLNNIFDTISPTSAAAGGTQTKKWFLRNDSVTDSLTGGRGFAMWIADAPDECTEQIGVGLDSSDDFDGTLGTMIALSGDALIAVVGSGPDTRVVKLVGLNTIGDPVVEYVTLTGTTPASSVVTFSELYGAYASALDVSSIITIYEGDDTGPVLSTIPVNRVATWQWLSPAALSSAILLSALDPGDQIAMWDEIAWAAGADEVDPDQSIISLERI